ncbi:type VI secretion system membrane subunit TssM [Azonexus sp.]|uniref:type VI secretion system membrane subunit TssM n=1 Tax=Azonexus sp. TaxID=1872668 RepID=UPI00283AB05D|nr:type VI secretion system membrane subunit TssM [Azonexus sp.]
MKKLVGFFISPAFLAVLAVVLVGLVIWFVGPLLAFDTLRPLASPGMRVTVIVLLLCFTLLLLKQLPVTFIGLAALSILVWHAGPLFKIGGTAPLAGEVPRLLVIALLVLPYLGWMLISLGRKLDKNQGLLQQILRLSTPKPESETAEKNIEALGGIVGTALERLRRMRSSVSGLRRLLEGKRYLYELPWYMVIGNAGAGKTTALLNSGLKLPLAEQMREQAACAKERVKDTVFCAWWLTNQAVLIDTAGRYANHAANNNPAENSAEWRGFLGLLRKHRPRAPINGALLVVSVAELLNDEAERGRLAAELRERLGELREVLGIRFPVYVLVSKMDLVQGFEEYFSTLGSEGRNQVWGFTLPYGEETRDSEADALAARCGEELKSLGERLDDGVNNRLLEEFDAGRSKRLSLLPQEFDKLRGALLQFLDDVFQESRYDATQARTTLRGVYFASASQTLASNVAADRDTLWQRLRRRFVKEDSGTGKSESDQTLAGNRSYFLHDLFQRLIFPEANLVRPNLRWEWRFRTLRLVGHTLVLFVFAWLITAVWISNGKNTSYLAEVREKTAALTPRLKEYLARPDSTQTAGLLDEVRDLPAYPGLDRDQPASDWRYGLYVGDDIGEASTVTQAALEDRILLPFVTRRMETALAEAIRRQDETAVYDALRVQLLLYGKDRYNAEDVRRWVLRDWESDSAEFGGQGVMLWHLRHLFDGSRVVQATGAADEITIGQARALLDSKPSLTRLYERLKVAIQPDSPEDFTVLRAVGPQAGAIFRRQSGASLDSGIPGLFTYAGYHELFHKRLPEFLGKAHSEDDWVMGRGARSGGGAKAAIAALNPDDRLVNEIRRLYLNEYAEHWVAFLDDIRPLTGDTRAFDLQIMRTLAAPDSPLMRLARAAVKETTLTRPIAQQDDNKSLLDKAQEEIARKARAAAGDLGLRGETRMERQLVDSRFAALREIVTGDADASGEKSGGAGKSGLDAVSALINDYYTQLVVADNTLSANGIPPPDTAGTKLSTEAARLPAPFRGVLAELSFEGARKVNASIGEILVAQTDTAVGDFCRRAVEGKYPFVVAEQEVDPDDFARLFSSGGLFDSFFEKNIKPYVDTTTQPWRYKQDSAGMPPIDGPSLASFAQAQRIRDAFFRTADGKRLGWKAEVRIAEMSPMITDLTLDIDGQVLRYAHGPNLPWNMVWPGSRGGIQAELTANPRIRADTSVFRFNGPWAVFRLLEHGKIQPSATAGRVAVEFAPDGRRIVLDIGAGTQSNPLSSDLLRGFRCPGRSS